MSSSNASGSPDNLVIVGGGPVGAMAAIYLAKNHADLFPGGIEIFERRADSRDPKNTAEAGRSINLAISSRSFYAWDNIDKTIKEDIIKNVGVKMYGRYIHSKSRKGEFQPYGRIEKDEFLLSVDRRYLNEHLISKAEALPNVKVHFETKLLGMDLRIPELTFSKTIRNEDGSVKEEKIVRRAKLVVAADGSNSQVRAEMQRTPKARFDILQHYISHSYKELTIKPGKDEKGEATFLMRPDSLHIWPRGDYMLIALPNPQKDFTATLFCPLEGENSFRQTLTSDEKVVEFFKREFPDAYDLMKDNLLEDWHRNPVSDLVYVKCEPYHFEDKVVLLGDSAHAIIPFYGQGCNSGIEDCRIFSECIEKFKSLGPNEVLKKALPYYTEFRKPSTDAILELSKENFIEMRDKTASKLFALQKKVGLILHKIMPETFKPLYTMVTFSPQIPYAQAWSTHLRRERRMRNVLKGVAVAATTFAGIAAYKWLLPKLSNSKTVQDLLNKFK